MASITFADDFQSYAPGSIPVQSDWSEVGGFGATAGGMVATGNPQPGGPQVAGMFKSNMDGFTWFPYGGLASVSEDMRVTARVHSGQNSNASGDFPGRLPKSFGVFGRGTASVADPTHVAARLNRDGAFELITRNSSAVVTVLASTPAQYFNLTWYRFELVFVGSRVTARLMDDSGLELAQLEATTAVSGGGYCGFTLTTLNLAGYTIFASDFFADYTYALPVGSPTDRYRLSLSADSRSLLASSSAVPFDASASVSLPPAVGFLPQQTLYSIRELTRDATAAVYDASFYPRATQNDRQERTYGGVTLLTRMQTSYPAPIFDTVTNLGLANNIASTIITYVLTQWAAEFPWFGFETVPDLRFPVPGSTGVKAPSEYQPAGDFKLTEGIIRSDIVALPQEDGNRRSMYDWLTDLLSPFPGAVFFQNSAGNLQIVPAYGPDADENPYKTLGSDDVVSVSLGEPSIGTIINRVTVSSRGYQRSDAVEVMQPAWFQVGAQQLYGEAVWYEPPVNRVNLQAPVSAGATIRQEDELTSADSFLAQTPTVWPVSTTNIPAGTGISLVDGLSASLVTVGWSRYTRLTGGSPGLAASGTSGLTLLETEVPFDGNWRPTLRWEGSAGLFSFSLVLNASWQPEQGGIALAIGSAVLSRQTGTGVFDEFVVEFTLDDESAGYSEQSGVTATFGTTTTSAENPIPNSDGSADAVTESQTTYGVLEKRVDVRGYVLSAEQALAMAQGIVLANLSPRAIRSLDLGWRGSTVALFDDRGRLFGTPDGGEGLLVGVEYSDDFISVTGGKRIRIEETVPSLPGFIPTDTEWLLNDDSSFWTNEDGTLSEPA